MADAGTTDNFNGPAFQAKRDVSLKSSFSDIEIEPVSTNERIDVRAGNLYIEQKAPNGLLKKGKLENYLDDAQSKFSDPKVKSVIGNNPTKLEVSAEDGLDSDISSVDDIKTAINDYMRYAYVEQTGPESNLISEIEIFLPNGQGSIIGIRGANGLFGNWQMLY
jgi:hypothetical protein